MPTDVTELDHVALAAEAQADLWPLLVGELGATWVGGGESPGFGFAQVSFANGRRVEVLEPARVDENDFLRRFLDRSGPGPHHLTFKVPDIRAALAALEAAGWPAVNVDFSDPGWQEAFLHPSIAHGIVVQLAQSNEELPPDEPPAELPTPRPARPASLDRIVHLVADLDRATHLFRDLLGGSPVGERGAGAGDHRWQELVWPGGGRLRLVQPTGEGPLASWLGARPGRLHHLEVAVDDPESVSRAHPRGDGAYEIAPADGCGTRFVLTVQA